MHCAGLPWERRCGALESLTAEEIAESVVVFVEYFDFVNDVIVRRGRRQRVACCGGVAGLEVAGEQEGGVTFIDAGQLNVGRSFL